MSQREGLDGRTVTENYIGHHPCYAYICTFQRAHSGDSLRPRERNDGGLKYHFHAYPYNVY